MKKWSDKFSVGNDLIDKQHEELFNIIYDIQDDIVHFRDAESSLLKLLVHIRDHFIDENKVLLKYSDNRELRKDIEEHIKDHIDFQEKVFDYVKDYIYNKKDIKVGLALHLKRWLSTHTINGVNIFKLIEEKTKDTDI